MVLLRPEDLLHKSYLNRLLIELVDNQVLSQNLYFKGGTAAAMLGFLDRFSVDLDFDVRAGAFEPDLRRELHRVFAVSGMEIDKKNPRVLSFLLKYPSLPGRRNSLKLDALNLKVAANIYRPQYLGDIDRVVNCQTIETMFANKLVALTDRFEKHSSLAGRDLYDIHHFFLKGYSYWEPIIKERTGLETKDYLEKLIAFIQGKVTTTIINEDLNTLLPNDHFQKIRKVLIPETLSFLKNELEKLPAGTSNN